MLAADRQRNGGKVNPLDFDEKCLFYGCFPLGSAWEDRPARAGKVRFFAIHDRAIWSCKLTKRCYIDPLKLFIGKVISLEKVLAGQTFVECQ